MMQIKKIFLTLILVTALYGVTLLPKLPTYQNDLMLLQLQRKHARNVRRKNQINFMRMLNEKNRKKRNLVSWLLRKMDAIRNKNIIDYFIKI